MIPWHTPLARWSRVRAGRDEEDLQRPVRTIALARVFLAVFSLAAIYLDPTEPTRFAQFNYSLMIVYVLYSIAAFVAVHAMARISRGVPFVLHVTDVVWATTMTFLTEGPNSPFYVFYLFVLLATAYRWGLRATILTALTLDALMIAQAYVIWSSPLMDVPIQLNRLIMRCTYITLMGFLAGFLAEAEKQVRFEATLSSRITGRIKAEAGVRGGLQVVFDSLLSVFGARRVLLFLEETAIGRKYVWEGRPLAGVDGCLLRLEELTPSTMDLSQLPRATVWQALAKNEGDLEISALSANQASVKSLPSHSFPRELLVPWSFRSAMGMRVSFGPEWEGALLILDPHFGKAHLAELRFLGSLVRQVEPAIYSLYLYRRLRARAGALERARVARELHDGVIQSLVSLELQMEAARSQISESETTLGSDLANIQEQLHHEVLAVRGLMDQLKPVPIGPRELLETLADRVDRFRHDTGIAARFVSDMDEAHLPPRTARELVRIVQEGLVNIRKHSGARNAMVHWSARNGNWILTLEDDGKGMGFTGRQTLADLDSQRKGPATIKERVRAISGDLTIESPPGGGCRIEITFPQRHIG